MNNLLLCNSTRTLFVVSSTLGKNSCKSSCSSYISPLLFMKFGNCNESLSVAVSINVCVRIPAHLHTYTHTYTHTPLYTRSLRARRPCSHLHLHASACRLDCPDASHDHTPQETKDESPAPYNSANYDHIKERSFC